MVISSLKILYENASLLTQSFDKAFQDKIFKNLYYADFTLTQFLGGIETLRNHYSMDLFIKTKEVSDYIRTQLPTFKSYRQWEIDENNLNQPIYNTDQDEATTFAIKLNLVPACTPQEFVSKVDFNVRGSYYDLDLNSLSFQKMDKRLVFNQKTMSPIASLKRAMFYISCGFALPESELMHIAKKIQYAELNEVESQ